MTGAANPTITIIGGGASGVLLALQLLRDSEAAPRVTLIERRGVIGEGLAYSTERPNHRVNSPARGMSAYADQPSHFLDWLRQSDATADPWSFVSRMTYGAYLRQALDKARDASDGRLSIIEGEAVALRETTSGVETVLDNGASMAGHRAVLAVGHETAPARTRGVATHIGSPTDAPLDPDGSVMILGSGLSMVDAWIGLMETGHRGPIVAVSRNGLLPQAHRDVAPLNVDAADVPFGTNLPYYLHWLRQLTAETVAGGGDWRSVIDGLRPYTQRLWQSWSLHTRRQFLEHARPWWTVHRHRLAPDLHGAISAALQSGRLRLVAAQFLGAQQAGRQVEATIRRRGRDAPESLRVDRLYDCGGVAVDVAQSSNPLVARLVSCGRARGDSLGIGLDVDDKCRLIDAAGNAARRIHVVGPLTRGQFFEIEAIAEIRAQCATLATELLAAP